VKNRLYTGLALLALAIGFTGCSTKQSWTLEEVAGVLDLSQLGERSYDKQGQMYLGGKLVPQEVLKQIKKPYGRTGNYLGLSEQAKASLSSELYTAATHSKRPKGRPQSQPQVLSTYRSAAAG
jgi:hypothetical protein